MTLEFQKDNKVKLIMSTGPAKMEFICDYTIDGDKVNIKPPQGMPGGTDDTLVLVKKGSNYEATEGGETITFVKK